MIIIVCIDSKNGMAFSGRRQSRDRILRQRVLSLAGTKKLWMNAYSAKQFADEASDCIVTDEQFLEHAGPGEYCFVENQEVSPHLPRIEGIILYRWNRTYPSDFCFTADLAEWKLEQTADFPGSSHERITEEIYGRGTCGPGAEVS